MFVHIPTTSFIIFYPTLHFSCDQRQGTQRPRSEDHRPDCPGRNVYAHPSVEPRPHPFRLSPPAGRWAACPPESPENTQEVVIEGVIVNIQSMADKIFQNMESINHQFSVFLLGIYIVTILFHLWDGFLQHLLQVTCFRQRPVGQHHSYCSQHGMGSQLQDVTDLRRFRGKWMAKSTWGFFRRLFQEKVSQT